MMPAQPDSAQMRFERKWAHLTRPHVRALAWLLDAPGLLDPACPVWQDRITTLGPASPATCAWLAALEHDPGLLDAALGARKHSRLGLYAEKLLAFYFEQHGILFAHGLQVRADKNDTVGEFDFLLRQDAQLLHWEFASKFYLLEPGASGFNQWLGPGLADTLGLKMRKILDQQLSLGRHPAAQSLLPQAIDRARALIKGWLFYPAGAVQAMPGIEPGHCHGFWCTLEQVAGLTGEGFVIMDRLQWLAPLKVAPGAAVLSKSALLALLAAQFATEAGVLARPVLVALVRAENGWLQEQERGFIVSDDWQQQAANRRQAGLLPA